MVNLKDRSEDTMRRVYDTEQIDRLSSTTQKLLSTATAVFLFLGAATNALAQTEFEGSLNSVSITDSAGTNNPPAANFTYTQDGDIIIFDASGSSDSDGSIAEYKWNFGDGTFAVGAIVSHQFEISNTYPVSLTVVDNNGGVSINQVSYNPPSAGTTTISNIGNDEASIAIYRGTPNQTIGQSFIGDGTQLYSLTVTTSNLMGDATTMLTARVGTSQDLSSSYFEAVATVVPSGIDSDVVFIWDSGPKLEAGVKYYFMIDNPGSWSGRVNFQQTSTQAYADGLAQVGANWVTADYASTRKDLRFFIGTK